MIFFKLLSTYKRQIYDSFFNIGFYKYLMLIYFLFPALVFGQEYDSYLLFNDFEIHAPSTPVLILDNELGIKMYSSEAEGIVILISKGPMGLEYDIGEYDPSVKKLMDESIIQGEAVADNTVTHFSSVLDSNENKYVASFFTDPVTIESGYDEYMAKKIIVKGKDRFIWLVKSNNKNNAESIFNKYKDRIK